MFSRTCFTSQFRDYTRSIQNNRKTIQLYKLKFSTTSILRTDEIDSQKYSPRIINDGSLTKSVYLRKVQQLFSNTNIGTLGAAGLVVNADVNSEKVTINSHVVDQSPQGSSTIISDVADQTASRILDPTVNVINENIVNAPESTVVDTTIAANAPQVTTEEIVEATVISSQANTENISSQNISIDPIPEPPAIPDYLPVDEVVQQLNALGQPTFASMGLGGWTPVGLIQECFEFFNVTIGVPWWGAIALGTVIIRLAMFPLVIISQRNAAKMNNNLPGLQAIQLKLTEARQSGNQLEAAKYSQEMMIFMKDKELNPLKNLVVPLAQMPVFVSFFMSLRQMANLPVESLKTGGILWFTDLTLPDQYFLLPIITSATLWATVEIGADTAKLSSQNAQIMKYVLRALPIVILPFTINFPGAILVYWASSNFVSLAQVGFLRLPKVREYFKIEKQIKFDPTALPIKPKGFKEGLTDSWTNMKIARQLEERRRLDEIQFRRAGKGPIVKTYKYDPTKQTSPSNSAAISAKER
ncbi:mitochondrial inner membrane protein OXA1L [Coccinella septempunctata]|uniref:mitochondrial inner membrane protein OXA1L n=1 Tax=Coccinella septempunctata TaxID=41139 RepID=UPI001D08F540|nr:mitochondrial inner membrane protein OXA1L [Coccinella septempunctata]